MHTSTPELFLNTVFDLREGEWGDEIIYSLMTPDERWRNHYYRRSRRCIPVGTAATYFCVSTVDRQPDYPRRGYRNVREAWVVVCDDVGTKAAPPPVRPSYVLESSLGNFQYGYLIEPYDVSTAAGRFNYDAVLYSLVLAGYNDPGCRNASRIVRLPGSLHRSGFVSRITQWQPERSWHLDDLLPAMGVKRVAAPNGSIVDAVPGKYSRLEDVKDAAYAWLVEHERVLGHSNEWVHIVCPWRQEHTHGTQSPTGTSYSPEQYGSSSTPAFKCLHGHCAGRGLHDFREWLRSEGCDAHWGDEDTEGAQRILREFMTTHGDP